MTNKLETRLYTTNDDCISFIRKNNIVFDHKNNTIIIQNAFSPRGTPPNYIDVKNTFQTKVIDLFKWKRNLIADNGNLIYHFSDDSTYSEAAKELSIISDKGKTGITGYWHSEKTRQTFYDVLNEIVEEKHPGKKIGTKVVSDESMVAYGSTSMCKLSKRIKLNARRIDPALAYKAVQTAYHESEHIAQFTEKDNKKFNKWALLSRKDKNFYNSFLNPVEEDARITGYTYGLFNANYLAEEMFLYNENNWQTSVTKDEMEILRKRIGGNDIERMILLNHVKKKETVPGPKTKKIIIDHISNMLKENNHLLQREDAVVIDKIANNTFDMYSRIAKNIGNITDINDRLDFIADIGPNVLTLDSLSYAYSEAIAQDMGYIQQIRREVETKAMNNMIKTNNIFSEARQSLKTTKIGNTMLGGGNSIVSKVVKWLR